MRTQMTAGGIAHVGRQNRRRKVDTLRPFIDTVAHARTAHGWLFGLERICSSTENCIGTIGGIGCIRMLIAVR